MGRLTMPGDFQKHPAVLIVSVTLLAMQFVGGPAAAQLSPYLSNNPSVIVDTEVLESLGGAPIIVDGIFTATPRAPVTVQRTVPLPPQTQRQAQRAQPQQPSPAVAPKSRLNSAALARLGLTPKAPTPPAKPVVPKQAAPVTPPAAPAPKPVPAPKPQTAAVAPAPASTATTTRTSDPTSAAAARVPTRPVLPPVTAPEPATARQVKREPAVTPPPPPAPPKQTTTVAKATPPAAAAAPAAAPVQKVTRTAAAAPKADDGLRLLFDDGSAKLPDNARSSLQSLTAQLGADEGLQVQLVAYAAGTAETSSQARRLSLSRALAVRSFLIDKGVRSTRMDIRALGNKAENGPADRVDVVLVQK